MRRLAASVDVVLGGTKKTAAVAVTFACGISLSAANATALPTIPPSVTSNGYEYKIVWAPGLTWAQAKSAAEAESGGWYLATIRSSTEDGVVRGLVESVTNSYSAIVDCTLISCRRNFYLGGTDEGPNDGTWIWIDNNQTFWLGTAGGSVQNGLFANWAINEPNNAGGGIEDYLVYNGFNGGAGSVYSFGWNDNNGQGTGNIFGYVMERLAPSSVPIPGTVALLGLGLMGIGAARRKQA